MVGELSSKQSKAIIIAAIVILLLLVMISLPSPYSLNQYQSSAMISGSLAQGSGISADMETFDDNAPIEVTATIVYSNE